MAGKKKDTKTAAEQVDQTQPEVQDQPEKDVFDEDEEALQGPPKLPADDPDAQDAPVASQDAPGDVPTQVKDKSTQEGQVDPERVPGDAEKAANEGLLEKKGDLQPIQDQKPQEPAVFQKTESVSEAGQVQDMNDPEFRQVVRRFLLAEMQKESGAPARTVPQSETNQNARGAQPEEGMAFKVARGMIGAFPEGSIIPDLKALGIPAEALPRLLDSGVLVPFKPESK